VTARDHASWLRRSLRGRRSRRAHHDRVVHALVAVAAAGDSDGLGRMLHPGVALTVDGGGKVPAPLTVLEGAARVGAYLAEVLRAPGTTLRVDVVNGMPGVVVCRDAGVVGIAGVQVRDRRIVEVWLVLNPEKLARWSGG
jgi:RNA polymerase sigma-70 factor (ECF subfamily)